MTEPSARLNAALSDRYTIERELGQGGMATVYLARDLKHDRQVAIKVLQPELAAIIGVQRFLSEIKTTAALQHPHILPLYDSGTADGFLYYVMPFVEGETLHDRLHREKQLPIDDAIRIATEVASALDYAHRHGVIHRDIKPSNILLHDGQALVADFGIALAVSTAGGQRLTESGLSLGTPQYMSPEQALGEREITARSDVYALGAVTYEMLVGDPPFGGSTVQAIVARVVADLPRSLTTYRHTVPAQVDAAVMTALEKLPADRFATAVKFAEALIDEGWTVTRHLLRPDTQRSVVPPVRRTVAAAALAAIVLLGALAAWGWLRSAPPQQVRRFSMALPPSQAMRQGVVGINLALSPDGSRMVYLGPGEGGNQLWVRERDRRDAKPLIGTVGAQDPYFSPDGERIAFFSTLDAQLKIVPVTGGPPITLVPGINAGGGGAWGADGWVYFDTPNGLSRIQADGGTPELLIPVDSAAREVGHAWPDALPNGKGLVYRSRRNMDPSDFDIVAVDLKTRERHVLTKGLVARYVTPGYLVFVRADGAMLAAPFDQDRLKLTGAAVPLFEGVMTKPFGSADVAISLEGTLVYVPGLTSNAGGLAELVYVSREGGITPLNPPVTFNPSGNWGLNLSPDGARIALDVVRVDSAEIWVKQLPAGSFSRLSFEGLESFRPRWTPDGRSLLYISTPGGGVPSVWKRRADGSTAAELVWKVPQPIMEASLSGDGVWLIYRITESGGNRDIYAVRPGRDSAPIPLLTGRFWEQGAALSPNGKWLAYTSNESGQDEIFVRPFPNTGAGRWQISTHGGSAARWAHSGRELFFIAPTGDLMVVAITPGPAFAPGEPRSLIRLGTGGFWGSAVVPYYDLTPDDNRFVMVRPVQVNQAPDGGQLVVVDNWFEELGRKMKPERK